MTSWLGCPLRLRVEGPGGPVMRLPRHVDGACVYLGKDNACRIHQHFGAASKPLMCRLYPFGFRVRG